ncbi:MAG TPA: TonB-dependent receptor, partial [Pyrinomonadaceae bacterium]
MKSLKLLAALFLMFTIGAGFVLAQSDRGTIRGTVTDPNGAIVPNARVVLTGTETGESRETTTSDEGIYVFPELRPQIYQISVEAAGFQRSTITDFKVAVQVTHTLNIELQVGAVTNEVTVTADTQALQADTVVIQTNVNERQVKELPLAVNSEAGGRTPLAFIFLDSNVSSTETGSTSGSVGGTNASRFRVSGGQALGTEILIDGASTRRAQNGTFFSEVAPGPNAFQEFTLSTSTFSAEFGNSSGGIVNFILKSGTNDFHGEVYDLLRNEELNANRIINKINGFERDRDNQNNFGFNIGGPIIIPGFGEGTKPVHLLRDRAFFFFNYEGYRFTEGETVVVTVPTLRMRNGDFGELLTDPDVLRQFPGGLRIYDPRPGLNITPANRPVFANNIIPQSAFDPAGFNALQAYPLPNRPGVFRNYVASSTRPNNMNQFTIKTDFNLSDRQKLNFSYSRRQFERIQGFTGPDGRPRFPRLPEPATAIDVWDQTFSSDFGRVQHNFIITPNFINTLNVGYTYYNVRNANTTEGFNTSSLGIPAGSTSNIAFPRILIDIYGEPDRSGDVRAYQSIGSTFFTDRIRDGALDISDFVTYVTGRHTIKFGGSYRSQQLNSFQRIDPGGTFRFSHFQTAREGDPNSGHPIASLITGAIDLGFTRRDTIDPSFTQITQSYFVQDDFKLTQKLTLNLGLRYDLPGMRTE